MQQAAPTLTLTLALALTLALTLKASEYVVFDAEDEPPGASGDGGAASGFDSITNPFGV